MADRTDLAEDRTNLAEDRTLLANERTFAGWMRTGLAGVGIGLGFHALFNRMEPEWAPRAIATAFMTVGALVFWAAERRACKVMSRLNPHKVKTFGAVKLRLVAAVTILATLLLVAAVWLLPIRPEG